MVIWKFRFGSLIRLTPINKSAGLFSGMHSFRD